MISYESLKGFTFAFALLYARVHADAKSGTSAGLSTGGGCFGELAGYTPGMGGSEDGDGKGAKRYGVTGMIDGPGSVSTLILVVVTEDGGGELLLPEEGKLAGLDVDVTEEDNDCDEGVNGVWDKGVWGEDVNGVPGYVEGKEDGGAAEAHIAETRRTRVAKADMDVQWGQPGGPVKEDRERARRQRGEMPDEGRTLIQQGQIGCRFSMEVRRSSQVHYGTALRCRVECHETRWNATW